MRGLFITFEGGDGAGKSTQIALLREKLSGAGRATRVTREPGGCPISEKVRDILLDMNNAAMDERTEALLYAASRAQHVQEVIRPALARGEVVLCDRFLDSSIAYQAYARGLGVAQVQGINQFAIQGLTPERTYFFMLGAKDAQRRRDRREATDRLEMEGMDLQARVDDGYRRILADDTTGRICPIDAAGSVEDIHETIWRDMLMLLD